MLKELGYASIAVFGLMNTLFLYAWSKKNNSIIDVWWGIGFALIALVTYGMASVVSARHLLITLMTCIWAARISLHLYIRNHGKAEDPRYAKWRQQWGSSVVWRSYVQVFMLQGLCMLIIALPIIVVNASPDYPLGVLDILGVIIWCIGILMESIADYQLKTYISDPAHRGHIMQEGLWRYSRHPNYVGEMLIWWGMFCVAVAVPNGLIALASPVLITFLLRFVSGVPLAEEQLKSLPGYDEYRYKTNVFLPWFRKK